MKQIYRLNLDETTISNNSSDRV